MCILLGNEKEVSTNTHGSDESQGIMLSQRSQSQSFRLYGILDGEGGGISGWQGHEWGKTTR